MQKRTLWIHTGKLLATSLLSMPFAFAQSAPAPADRPSMVTLHLNTSSAWSLPVKVVGVMLGGQQVPLDTPIRVEGMWMRTISVTIQNTSPKPIVKCGIDIEFPEAIRAATGPVPNITMSLGRFPHHAFMRRDGTTAQLHEQPDAQIQVQPGESATLKAVPGTDLVQADAYKVAGHISNVSINLDTIYFLDESRWLDGTYYVAVPPPTLWQEVTPTEFSNGAP
ncbi:MAG: hypothetical protein ACRD4E_04275, partial [Bryobacteraceae bacterium]